MQYKFTGIRFYTTGKIGLSRSTVKTNGGYVIFDNIDTAARSLNHTLKSYSRKTASLAVLKKMLVQVHIKIVQEHVKEQANLKDVEKELSYIYKQLNGYRDRFSRAAARELNKILILRDGVEIPHYERSKRHIKQAKIFLEQGLKEIYGIYYWNQERLSCLNKVKAQKLQ